VRQENTRNSEPEDGKNNEDGISGKKRNNARSEGTNTVTATTKQQWWWYPTGERRPRISAATAAAVSLKEEYSRTKAASGTTHVVTVVVSGGTINVVGGHTTPYRQHKHLVGSGALTNGSGHDHVRDQRRQHPSDRQKGGGRAS